MIDRAAWGLVRAMNLLRAEGAVSTDLDTFLTTIKGGLTEFTTTNLGKILVAGLAVSVGLVIAWFGYRFVKRKVSGAMKSGRL